MSQPAANIHLSQLKQTAQSGGYWLISAVLNDPIEKVCAYYAVNDCKHPVQNEQACSNIQHRFKLSLFDYQFPKLQLLSKQPLRQTFLDLDALTLTQIEHTLINFEANQTTLLLGHDLGIGPLFYTAKQIKNNGYKHLALLEASSGFPFAVKPAQFMLQDFPFEAIGGCSLLEDWKIANRLASDLGLPGCFEGSITTLIKPWLVAENQRQAIEPIHWQILSFLPEEKQQILTEITRPYTWLSLKTI